MFVLFWGAGGVANENRQSEEVQLFFTRCDPEGSRQELVSVRSRSCLSSSDRRWKLWAVSTWTQSAAEFLDLSYTLRRFATLCCMRLKFLSEEERSGQLPQFVEKFLPFDWSCLFACKQAVNVSLAQRTGVLVMVFSGFMVFTIQTSLWTWKGWAGTWI